MSVGLGRDVRTVGTWIMAVLAVVVVVVVVLSGCKDEDGETVLVKKVGVIGIATPSPDTLISMNDCAVSVGRIVEVTGSEEVNGSVVSVEASSDAAVTVENGKKGESVVVTVENGKKGESVGVPTAVVNRKKGASVVVAVTLSDLIWVIGTTSIVAGIESALDVVVFVNAATCLYPNFRDLSRHSGPAAVSEEHSKHAAATLKTRMMR